MPEETPYTKYCRTFCLYVAIGLSPDATFEAIDRATSELSRQWVPSFENTRDVATINIARILLSDPPKRIKYDMTRGYNPRNLARNDGEIVKGIDAIVSENPLINTIGLGYEIVRRLQDVLLPLAAIGIESDRLTWRVFHEEIAKLQTLVLEFANQYENQRKKL